MIYAGILPATTTLSGLGRIVNLLPESQRTTQVTATIKLSLNEQEEGFCTFSFTDQTNKLDEREGKNKTSCIWKDGELQLRKYSFPLDAEFNPHYVSDQECTFYDLKYDGYSVSGAAAVTSSSGSWHTKRSEFTFKPVVVDRCFENSNYCRLYSQSRVNFSFMEGFGAISNFIDVIVESRGIDESAKSAYKEALENHVRGKSLDNVEVFAAVYWTSSDLLDGTELCSHINLSIIEDTPPAIDAVVPICRLTNTLIATRVRQGDAQVEWPIDYKTYRGLGMPEEHFAFFEVGKIYRAPMFLASSTRKETAEAFMQKGIGNGRRGLIFTIQFDCTLRCNHVNHLEAITTCKGEDEFLMPPYSGFRVMETKFDPFGVSNVIIWAFPDNKDPRLERVELAPWH